MRSVARLIAVGLAGSVLAVAFVAGAVPASWDVRRVNMQLPARVRISGGWFTMGSAADDVAAAVALCAQQASDPKNCQAPSFASETPAQHVYVRAFAIDRLEVSNAEHQRCVSAGRCYPPQLGAAGESGASSVPEQPVVQLGWSDARDYCRFAGGDLPTEAQWEYAARGSSQRMFPWGKHWNDALARFARPGSNTDGPSAVDAYPDGKSFFGLLNMAGNVSELVLDRYAPGYDAARQRIDPEGPATGSSRVLRGGSFRSLPHALRVSHRDAIGENEARDDVGLRCAYGVR